MMKRNPQEIRAALDRRLSFLHEDGARRARIRRAINAEQTTGKPRKTAWIALTAVTALIVAGVAFAAGLNLLDLSGNRDARNGEPAPRAEMDKQWVFAAAQDPHGTVSANITSVYYDSDSLIVTYLIENGTWGEPFTPTREQLAGMTKIAADTLVIADDAAQDPTVRQYLDAVKSGTPAGISMTTIVADDHTLISPGVDLGAADKVSGEITDGKARSVRQYAVSLPDRDYLNVEIALWKNTAHLYFDGTDTYMSAAQPEAFGDMVSMVWHAENETETRRMTGKSMLADGTAVQAEAEVSATYGKVTLTAYGAGFAKPNARDLYAVTNPEHPYDNAQELIGDCWYRLFVEDSGKPLAVENTSYTDARTITATFAGTGRLPETLTVMPILESTSLGTNITPLITLTPADDLVYVSTWAELSAAAEAGATNVVVTANIVSLAGDQPIVFHNAVTLQAEGMHYNIITGGQPILRVEGPDENTPLTDETVIRNLVLINGQTMDDNINLSQGAYDSAVFVQGPLRMENCAVQFSQATNGALCVSGGDLVLTDSWLMNNASTGLCIRNGSASIIGCKIAENHSQNGGGIYGENADITLINSRISRNVGEEAGGGIYLLGGELTLSGCTLEGNITQGSGGAVFAEHAAVTLGQGSLLQGNQAGTGGGVHVIDGTVELSGAEITNNEAGDGGGVSLDKSDMEISSGTISGNTSQTGGGLFVWFSQLRIQGGSITQNRADEIGGGIYMISSTMSGEPDEINDNMPENVVEAQSGF